MSEEYIVEDELDDAIFNMGVLVCGGNLYDAIIFFFLRINFHASFYFYYCHDLLIL